MTSMPPLTPQESLQKPQGFHGKKSRRSFLTSAAFFLLGLTAAVFSGISAGVLLTPLRRRLKKRWLKAGDLSVLASSFRPLVLERSVEDGWRKIQRADLVFVNGKNPAQPVVFSAVCSHMGCNVAWKKDKGEFQCPCHGGAYNAQGEVIGGPPPRPLQKLPAKVEKGFLYIEV